MELGLDDLPEPADLHGRLSGSRALDWGTPIPTKAEIAELYGARATVQSLMLLARAAEVEQSLTADVVASIADGIEIYQLESRLKSPQSLARKIHTQAGTRFDKVPIEDVVRYTIVTPEPDDLVPATRENYKSLDRRDWTISGAVHSYADGSRYKGLHLYLQKHRERVEMQIHSHESIEVKDRTRPLYIVERDPKQPPGKRAEARNAAIALSAQMRKPRGIDDFTTLGGVPVEVRVYGKTSRPPAGSSRSAGPTLPEPSTPNHASEHNRKGGMAR